MPDVTRICPKCPNRLRSNNTRGVCNSCWEAGVRPDGVASPKRRKVGLEAEADDLVDVLDRLNLGDAPKSMKPPPKARAKRPTSDAVKRMQVVAAAFGLNGEQLLEDFAQGWLNKLKAGLPK